MLGSGPDWGLDLNCTELHLRSSLVQVQFSTFPGGLVHSSAGAGYLVHLVQTGLHLNLSHTTVQQHVILL
jgi:hypothetical protein